MKRLLLILLTSIASIAVCFGQNAPKLHNEEIESSDRYQKGISTKRTYSYTSICSARRTPTMQMRQTVQS